MAQAEPDAVRAPERFAQAMLGRAVTLRAVGREAEASEVLREIIARFGSHAGPVALVVQAASEAAGDG